MTIPPPIMTPRQIELARHALGLARGRGVAYRNRFCAGPGHDDYEEWGAMVEAGLAWRRAVQDRGGDYIFHLTEAGKREAMRPGEREMD